MQSFQSCPFFFWQCRGVSERRARAHRFGCNGKTERPSSPALGGGGAIVKSVAQTACSIPADARSPASSGRRTRRLRRLRATKAPPGLERRGGSLQHAELVALIQVTSTHPAGRRRARGKRGVADVLPRYPGLVQRARAPHAGASGSISIPCRRDSTAAAASRAATSASE